MLVGQVHTPRQSILRFVVTLIRNPELNPVERLIECLHHRDDDFLVIVFLDSSEIEIG